MQEISQCTDGIQQMLNCPVTDQPLTEAVTL